MASFSEWVIFLVLAGFTILGILSAILIHEVAHGYIALYLGDPTAQQKGRLSLNPVRHFDWIGTCIVPLFTLLGSNMIFGWIKPVPVDGRYFKNPRRDMALVALAGPLSNLVMWLFWASLLRFTTSPIELFGMLNGLYIWSPLATVAIPAVQINATLFVLNLLPIPPLDGSRLYLPLLPDTLLPMYGWLERYGILIVVLLLVSGMLNFLTPLYHALISLSLTYPTIPLGG